jgi:hypothetical protein
MPKTGPLPRWDEKRKRWHLNGRKPGVLKAFYSSKPGRAGELEAIRKYRLWKIDEADKSEWRFEKAWDAYLIASEDTRLSATCGPSCQRRI